MKQMTLFRIPKGERTDLVKRNWENAFQRWSDMEHRETGVAVDTVLCAIGAMEMCL